MTNMIKLANGSQVTIDEFISWSAQKQMAQLRYTPEVKAKSKATRQRPEVRARLLAAAQIRAEQLRGRQMAHMHSGWYFASPDKAEQAKQRLRELNAQQFATPESRVSRSLAGQQQFATEDAKHDQRLNRSRPVMTPLGEFPGRWAVAEAMGTNTHQVDLLMKKYPKQYYYLCGERGKPVVTPEGMFISGSAAAKHYQVGGDTIRRWCKKLPDQFYLIPLQEYIKQVGAKKVGIQSRAEILAQAHAEKRCKNTTKKIQKTVDHSA
jgi:hypothetical protein